MRDDPVQTTARGIAMLTIPTMIAWLLNHEEEWYQELPEWQRRAYWNFSMDGGKTVVSLPKPFELGMVFASMPEDILNELGGDATMGLMGTIRETINSFLPMNFLGSDEWLTAGTAAELTPIQVRPMAEAAFNYDAFREQPVVSPWTERGKLPEDQYGAWTTEASKALGKVIGVSPAKIDHVLGGYTGGLAIRGIRTMESLLRVREARVREGLAGVPVVDIFVKEGPELGRSRSMDDLYRLREDLSQKAGSKKATAEELAQLKRLNHAADVLKEIRDAVKDGTMERTDAGVQMLDVARWAMERDN